MKSIILVVFLSLFTSILEAAEENARLLAKAFDILAGESLLVEKYRTGFAPTKPTEIAWAFSVVVRESRKPVKVFTELSKTGSYYALIGLYVYDKLEYDKAIKEFSGQANVCILSGDSFGEVSGEEFVRKYIEKDGKKIFDALVFDELPDWRDTVKISSPCKGLHGK